jgi:hypothetical protein
MKDMIYITIECRMHNCLDGIKEWALELHHGFTTQGQPWRLGHGLGHLLVSVRKVVPTLTSKSVEIYLSMAGAKQLVTRG